MRKTANVNDMLIAMIPGGIEASEKIGQIDVARSETLPRIGLLGEDRARWESVGVRILDEGDSTRAGTEDALFCRVELPAGWRKVPADHYLYTNLVDQRGRERGQIFYKAAFYDRSANITMLRRFGVKRDYARDDFRSVIQYQVTDGGVVVFRSEERSAYDTGKTGEHGVRAYALNDVIEMALKLSCLTWLAERGIVDHDPAANWDADVAPAGVDEAPPPIGAPPGRLSGHDAIALARGRKSKVLVGDDDPKHALEVHPDDAQKIVDDRKFDEGIFWIDEPAPAVAQAGVT